MQILVLRQCFRWCAFGSVCWMGCFCLWGLCQVDALSIGILPWFSGSHAMMSFILSRSSNAFLISRPVAPRSDSVLHTLRPILDIPHSTPSPCKDCPLCTPHPAVQIYPSFSTCYASRSHMLHSTLCASHFPLHSLRPTLCTSHSTLTTPHSTFHTPCYASYLAPPTPRQALHTTLLISRSTSYTPQPHSMHHIVRFALLLSLYAPFPAPHSIVKNCVVTRGGIRNHLY